MSSCGRGRGWLNLAKNCHPPKPVGLVKPPVNNLASTHPTNVEYRTLVEKISELSENEDGMTFNIQIKDIKTCWLQECSNKEDVEASFEYLYSASLHDVNLASKLVTLIACHSFISQDIQQCNLRHLFLKHLQQDFESSNQLQNTNPQLFRNCVYIIGQFFHKARLLNGEPFKFLAPPFLSCLELLVSSKSPPDLMLFTTQLFLNGMSLKSMQPEGLVHLSVKIRTILVLELHLVKEAKLWLMLALDLFNGRFEVLQPEIYKFYEQHLGATSMITFQKVPVTLNIETVQSSKILDTFESKVNVLQISTLPAETPVDEVQNSGCVNSVEYDNKVLVNHISKDVPAKTKEKTGRPILGVGIRSAKKKVDEENGAWSHKQNTSEWMHKKPTTFKRNKGWEHDDRCENNYD